MHLTGKFASPAIETIRQGDRPAFGDAAEEEIHDFCTGLRDNKRFSDAGFARTEARHGRVGAVELAGLLGHYNLIAITLNIAETPVPGGAKPLAD